MVKISLVSFRQHFCAAIYQGKKKTLLCSRVLLVFTARSEVILKCPNSFYPVCLFGKRIWNRFLMILFLVGDSKWSIQLGDFWKKSLSRREVISGNHSQTDLKIFHFGKKICTWCLHKNYQYYNIILKELSNQPFKFNFKNGLTWIKQIQGNPMSVSRNLLRDW